MPRRTTGGNLCCVTQARHLPSGLVASGCGSTLDKPHSGSDAHLRRGPTADHYYSMMLSLPTVLYCYICRDGGSTSRTRITSGDMQQTEQRLQRDANAPKLQRPIGAHFSLVFKNLNRVENLNKLFPDFARFWASIPRPDGPRQSLRSGSRSDSLRGVTRASCASTALWRWIQAAPSSTRVPGLSLRTRRPP